MISGTVNSKRQPVVPLVIGGPAGATQQIDCVVDTAFNGFVTLPSVVALMLGLPFLFDGPVTLADGSQQLFPIHGVTVHWDGKLRYVEADVIDSENLIGTALMEGHDLQIRLVVGGAVTITPIP